jgi:hypothetical protein
VSELIEKQESGLEKSAILLKTEWTKYILGTQIQGSSDRLNADVLELGEDNFIREIIHICPSRGIASYLEAREQFERRVLETDQYYNGIINVRVGGSKILKEHLQANHSNT